MNYTNPIVSRVLPLPNVDLRPSLKKLLFLSFLLIGDCKSTKLFTFS